MRDFTKKLIYTACAALLLTGAAACSPTTNVRGNMLEDYQLTELQPGVDTQQDVRRKIGSPTTRAPFDDNVWYYLGQETEKKSIFDPKIVDERVVVLFFDQDGVLSEVQDVDNNRLDLPYVREKTATSGNEMTVMQQFLGNLGRFNKASGGAN